jgi:FkbM family methyltransferase
MLGTLLRNAVNGALKRKGYSLQWLPYDETAEVPISLEFVVGHLMMFHPKPVFLEIGANDGVSNDSIFPFIDRFGWTGIMVEPLPAPFAKLTRNYARFPQVHLVNAAIGDTDGQSTLYKIKDYDGQFSKSSQYASFSKEIVASQTQYVPNAPNEIEEIQVPCLTLPTLLKKYPVGSVDVMITDAEGYDSQILRMIDFRELNPAIIQFEHCSMDKQERGKITSLLAGQGYRLFSDSLDTIAYRAPVYLGWRVTPRGSGESVA